MHEMRANRTPCEPLPMAHGPGDADQHRHRCEVRQLLLWRAQHGREWVREWLSGVERRRGPDAAQRMRSDAALQWGRGNRGESCDWR